MTQVGICGRQPSVAHGVVIIGSGIAGLATALALSERGRRVTLVERDPPPPEIPPEDAFERWERPGVPQFHHAHMFLARLQTMLRDRHPELLRALFDAGLELSRLRAQALPAAPPRAELLDRLRRALRSQDAQPVRGSSRLLVGQAFAQEGQRRASNEAPERVEQPHR